jgi:hypothetical protein
MAKNLMDRESTAAWGTRSNERCRGRKLIAVIAWGQTKSWRGSRGNSRRPSLQKYLHSAILVTALAFSLALQAQTGQHTAIAKTPAASVHPDFSGVWFEREYHRNILSEGNPPLQPWADELYKKRKLEVTTSDPDHPPDPVARCIPPGVPRIMYLPFPWEIVHARDRVVMIFEVQIVRQIFTDGRGHAKDVDPTYMGDSVGKWEGDTLVIDTVGLNDKTWLDANGLPHSDALHVVERLRRIDHDTLKAEFTIDDPKAFTKPWTVEKLFDLKPDWHIKEYVCAEDNEIK